MSLPASAVQPRLASLLDFTVIKMASVPIEGDGFLNGGSWSGERRPYYFIIGHLPSIGATVGGLHFPACFARAYAFDLIKDRIVPREIGGDNWCELYILRDSCFCMVIKSGMVDWNEGLGRLCRRLDIMGRPLLFLAGGSRLEESSVRGFCARSTGIVGWWYGVCSWASRSEVGNSLWLKYAC